MLTHNTYFEGAVQSVGFTRHGRKHTVGVIAPGTFRFGTDAPERMTVVSGALAIRRDGDADFTLYPCGTTFEVAGKSSFEVRAVESSAYLCEFL